MPVPIESIVLALILQKIKIDKAAASAYSANRRLQWSPERRAQELKRCQEYNKTPTARAASKVRGVIARRAKGLLSMEDHLKRVSLPPGERERRRLAYQAEYYASDYWRERAKLKRMERAGKMNLPAHHKEFLARKRSSYLSWWQRTIYRQDHPAKKPVPKRNPDKPLFRNIRKRLRRCLKSSVTTKTQTLTGCTQEFLFAYLESKFKRGMTWANYGSFWHIDHIIPLSRFNLKDPLQFAQSCHFTNLQPLQARLNESKADKLLKHEQTHMPLATA